jgi:hypothetical protein
MNPYDPSELDRVDPELDRIARQLEEHAAGTSGEPSLDLVSRVWAAVEAEPVPASRWAWLAAWRRPARAVAMAAVVVAAVTGALAVGQLLNGLRPDVGDQPTPVVLPSPSGETSPSPSPSPTPSATPSPSPSPTVSPTSAPTVAPSTPQATPSDDDDDIETPEPSDSDEDNSEPGGGDSGSGDD